MSHVDDFTGVSVLSIDWQSIKLLKCSSDFFLHENKFWTYLLLGVLTKALDIFWSIKNNNDRQKPNPAAPKIPPQDKVWTGAISKKLTSDL